MNKQLITTFLFLLVGVYVFGQKDTSVLRSANMDDECFGITKYHDEYIIRLNGIDYNDKEKAFICQNDLPMNVEVLYKIDNSPVIANNWDWASCNDCSPSNPANNIGQLNFEIFNDSKFDLVTTFLDTDDPISLELKISIISNIIDHKATHIIATYGYDENDELNYPFHNDGTPWKFIPKIGNDKIHLHKHPNLIKNTSLESNPATKISHSANSQEITLEYQDILTRDSVHSTICGEDHLLYNDIYEKSILNVYLWKLCESDDDFENYCVDKDPSDPPRSGDHDYDGSLDKTCTTLIKDLPNAATFVCIDKGLDGAYDYYLDITEPNKFWSDKDNDATKPNDGFQGNEIEPYNLIITPSLDGTGNMFCNERVLTKPSEWNTDVNGDGILDAFIDLCPDEPDIVSMQNNLNLIYNQAGITVNLLLGNPDNVYANYDVSSNNIPGISSTLDALGYHAFVKGGNLDELNKSTQTSIWYVKHLDGKRGVAPKGYTDMNFANSVLLSDTQQGNITLSHELGHAKFNLFHPDGMEDDLYTNDRLDEPVLDDKYNFMNSGTAAKATPIEEHIVRRYQWKFIKDGK